MKRNWFGLKRQTLQPTGFRITVYCTSRDCVIAEFEDRDVDKYWFYQRQARILISQYDQPDFLWFVTPAGQSPQHLPKEHSQL